MLWVPLNMGMSAAHCQGISVSGEWSPWSQCCSQAQHLASTVLLPRCTWKKIPLYLWSCLSPWVCNIKIHVFRLICCMSVVIRLSVACYLHMLVRFTCGSRRVSCFADKLVLAHGAEATQEGRADGCQQRIEACRGPAEGWVSFFVTVVEIVSTFVLHWCFVSSCCCCWERELSDQVRTTTIWMTQ